MSESDHGYAWHSGFDALNDEIGVLDLVRSIVQRTAVMASLVGMPRIALIGYLK